MFDLRRGRALWTVAQCGSLSAASQLLHVSSSALSQQLAKLESEVGQPLLLRRGRGVELTDAGNLFCKHIGDILRRVDEAEVALDAARGEVVGKVRVAAFATATRAILPRVVRALHESSPRLEIESQECEPAEAQHRLDRGEIDVAVIDEWFSPRPQVSGGVKFRHIGDDVADLAVPAAHPLAVTSGTVDLTECANERWISWRPGEFGHDWLRMALASECPGLKFQHTAGEHQTILALVEAGLGIALMPRLGRGSVPESVSIRPISPPITRRLYVIWKSAHSTRPTVRAVVEALEIASRPG